LNRPYDDQSQLKSAKTVLFGGRYNLTDTILKYEGLKALNDRFGPVDMERFLVLMSREQNDYTQWHEQQPDTMSVREYSAEAMEYQRHSVDTDEY
jgi:hypothetical protein